MRWRRRTPCSFGCNGRSSGRKRAQTRWRFGTRPVRITAWDHAVAEPRNCVERGDVMRLFAVALTLTLGAAAAPSAQTATPESENGPYSLNSLAGGVVRLDTRTGQVSQCSRSDAGWACKVVPDERSALETEIVRLQGENATMKKELFSRGLPVPGVSAPSGAKPGEGELKLPSDAEVDKVVAFLEKVWRRLIEMGKNVQKEVEKKN